MAEANAGTRLGPAWVTAGDALGRNRWLSHEATAGSGAFGGPVGSGPGARCFWGRVVFLLFGKPRL